MKVRKRGVLEYIHPTIRGGRGPPFTFYPFFFFGWIVGYLKNVSFLWLDRGNRGGGFWVGFQRKGGRTDKRMRKSENYWVVGGGGGGDVFIFHCFFSSLSFLAGWMDGAGLWENEIYKVFPFLFSFVLRWRPVIAVEGGGRTGFKGKKR